MPCSKQLHQRRLSARPAMSNAAASLSLKKQLLVTRAALERAEMVGSIDETVQSVAYLRSRLPALALGRIGKGLPLAMGLIQRARLLAPVLPLVWTLARRPLLRYALLGAGAAFVAWKARRWIPMRPKT
jgi:hypothetical protein